MGNAFSPKSWLAEPEGQLAKLMGKLGAPRLRLGKAVKSSLLPRLGKVCKRAWEAAVILVSSRRPGTPQQK